MHTGYTKQGQKRCIGHAHEELFNQPLEPTDRSNWHTTRTKTVSLETSHILTSPTHTEKKSPCSFDRKQTCKMKARRKRYMYRQKQNEIRQHFSTGTFLDWHPRGAQDSIQVLERLGPGASLAHLDRKATLITDRPSESLTNRLRGSQTDRQVHVLDKHHWLPVIKS